MYNVNAKFKGHALGKSSSFVVKKLCIQHNYDMSASNGTRLLLLDGVLHTGNIESYQDGFQLVTVCAHGDFIVLSHWETRPPPA